MDLSSRATVGYIILGIIALIALIAFVFFIKGIRDEIKYNVESLPDVEGVTIFSEKDETDLPDEPTESVFYIDDSEENVDLGSDESNEIFNSFNSSRDTAETRKSRRLKHNGDK